LLIALLLAVAGTAPGAQKRAAPSKPGRGIALVPAAADGALVLDGASGIAGIRALLETAGRRAASFSPGAIGRSLQDRVGVDLLAEPPEWSLAPRGARALVAMQNSVGLSAPVAKVKAARRALAAWLGPGARPTRQKPLKGPLAAGNRAGMIAPVAGSQRLLIASGKHAAALVSALAHPSAFSRDKALLAKATGPAWLYLKGRPPLRAAIFALDASATGLVARGLVTPVPDPILAGTAPAPCDGAPIGCLRAGLGPSGRGLLALALAPLQTALPAGDALIVRLDGIDVQQLGDERSLPRALRISAKPADAQPGPALDGTLNLAAIDDALAHLTPLDAIRGSLAAGVYAGHLLYGPLLRNLGPLTLSGEPAGTGAEIEIRLPAR
jgi:hypothetical protein